MVPCNAKNFSWIQNDLTDRQLLEPSHSKQLRCRINLNPKNDWKTEISKQEVKATKCQTVIWANKRIKT